MPGFFWLNKSGSVEGYMIKTQMAVWDNKKPLSTEQYTHSKDKCH